MERGPDARYPLRRPSGGRQRRKNAHATTAWCIASRPAAVGGACSTSFRRVDHPGFSARCPHVAVCRGTGSAFARTSSSTRSSMGREPAGAHARFRQVDMHEPRVHHDGEFPTGASAGDAADLGQRDRAAAPARGVSRGAARRSRSRHPLTPRGVLHLSSPEAGPITTASIAPLLANDSCDVTAHFDRSAPGVEPQGRPMSQPLVLHPASPGKSGSSPASGLAAGVGPAPPWENWTGDHLQFRVSVLGKLRPAPSTSAPTTTCASK